MATEVDEPSGLFFFSAFQAMEPSDWLISLARQCGGGSITEQVQRFIWDHCICKTDGTRHEPYLKKFLKKLITEIELNHGEVLDEIYEQYAHYMASLDDDPALKENTRVFKYISFLFPDDSLQSQKFSISKKLMIPLQCSLNMLEGDTGCSVWPSSLFLSEFILSNPGFFCGKSCFEVGSGVGLVGICLSHVKALKVTLSDGDLSTLANMKLNLESNRLKANIDILEGNSGNVNLLQVKCICLPWECAVESELQEYMPDIINHSLFFKSLGADVIYDPLCLPHLVRVLKILLDRTKSFPHHCEESNNHGQELSKSNSANLANGLDAHQCGGVNTVPVAYIASVIRNADTFNYFLELAKKASLTVIDQTEKAKLFNLLPYMQSYNRSIIRLFAVSSVYN